MKIPTIGQLRKRTKSKRRGLIYPVVDYLAYYPARLFLYINLTPNQITVLWILVQIVSAFFLLAGDYIITLVALLVFQSMFIIDCADGIVARYKNQFSLNGVYLDRLGHYVADPFLLVCFGLGLYNSTGNLLFIMLGIVSAVAFLLNKAITLNPLWYPDKQRLRIEKSLKGSELKSQNDFLYFIFELFRLEYPFNLMFLGVLLGFSEYTLMVYTAFFVLELSRKAVGQLVWNHRLE